EGAEGDERAPEAVHQGLEARAPADEAVVEHVGPGLEDVGPDDGDGALEVVVAVGGLADGADLALVDEAAHLAGRVVEVAGAAVGREGAVVEVVDVDVVDAEVAEALLALAADVVGLESMLGGAAHVPDL